MKYQLLQIAVVTALVTLAVAVWKLSLGTVLDVIFLTILVAGLVYGWIIALKMRRKIRGVLGREATDQDLASIKTWIKVDETEALTGNAQTPRGTVASDGYPRTDTAITPQLGSGRRVSLFSHSYANIGNRVVPTTFRAGKTPYVLMVVGPILLIWWAGPTRVSHAPWFHWAAIIYGVGVAAAAVCLRELKLEIRPDGISYASLFCGGKSIQFSDISSAVVLTDPHYRNQWWPEFNWYDLVIMPKPETGKPPLKIAFLLFPSEAREQLIQLLAPEELDTGEA